MKHEYLAELKQFHKVLSLISILFFPESPAMDSAKPP